MRTQYVRALAQGLINAKLSTGGRPSAAKFARALGKNARTGRRILSGKTKLDLELMAVRAPWLYAHVLRCLILNERKAGAI